MRNIAIFGSTGSIGKASLEVIEHLKSDFKVYALAAGVNYRLLVEQIIRTRPQVVVIRDEKNKEELFKLLASKNKTLARKTTILVGISGLIEICQDKNTDILILAMTGTEGILPLLKAIENRKHIALATKELLVSFGKIIMQKQKEYNTALLPIDSELVGLHQCLYGQAPPEVKRVIITASGGPFFLRKDLSRISLKQALCHPIWKMGKKNTIDSATLANKGLEVIEVCRLFSLPVEKIQVLIHPQCIIHSMVEFIDHSVLAQLSLPDMRLCIQYALTFPERKISLVKSLDLTQIKKLEFYAPDVKKFPALQLAYDALSLDGNQSCVYNSANEIAVKKFLQGKIEFKTIPKIIKKVMETIPYVKNPNLKTLLKCEQLAKEYAEKISQ